MLVSEFRFILVEMQGAEQGAEQGASTPATSPSATTPPSAPATSPPATTPPYVALDAIACGARSLVSVDQRHKCLVPHHKV